MTTKRYSTKTNTTQEIDEILLKKGLTKNFNVGDIVIVKLKDNTNPWPGKISQFFIQEVKQKKIDSLQQQYDPTLELSQTNIKRKPKRKLTTKKEQLIYKVRYFGCQEFVYSEEKFIETYSLVRERELEGVRDRTLSKALELARKEMGDKQREIVDKGEVTIVEDKKKLSITGGRKKKNSLVDREKKDKLDSNKSVNLQQIKYSQKQEDSEISQSQQQEGEIKRDKLQQDSYTTQVQVMDKKAEKKKKLQQKILKLQQGLQKQAKKLRNPKLVTQAKEKKQQQTELKMSQQNNNIVREKNKESNQNEHKTTQSLQQRQIIISQSKGQRAMVTSSLQPVVKQQYIQPQQNATEQPTQHSQTISNNSDSQSSEELSPPEQQQQPHQQQPQQQQSSIYDPQPQSSHNITIMSQSLPQDQSTPMLVGGNHQPSHKPLQKIVKEEYLLDNILYKNKYQLLGVFTQLLEWCLTRVLWLRAQEVAQIEKNDLHLYAGKQLISANVVTQEDKKKIITLRKILDAQVFTLEELEKSQSMQKIINIIKIGQLTHIERVNEQLNKNLAQGSERSKNFAKGSERSKKPQSPLLKDPNSQFNKKLLKIYTIMQKQLKHFGKFSIFSSGPNKRDKRSINTDTIAKQCSFGQMPYEYKKQDQETSSSDCVQNVTKQTQLANKHQVRARPSQKNKLRIDYTGALSLSSNELVK